MLFLTLSDRQSGNTCSIQSTCGKVNFESFSVKVETQLSVAGVALQNVAVDRLLVHLWTSFIISDKYIKQKSVISKLAPHVG